MLTKKNQDLSTVKGRLLAFIAHKGISQVEFTAMLGVSPAYIAAMRKSLSHDKLLRLNTIFPDLNRDWLLYGTGEMLLPSADECDEPTEDITLYSVPLLPVAAYAGNLQMWNTSIALKDCERIISPVKGADYAIRISGDSMEPKLQNGATVLIKRINDEAFIPWGNPMVFDTENGVLVKDIFPDDDPLYLQAHSENPRYPSIRIPKSSIYGLYRVMGAITVFNTL